MNIVHDLDKQITEDKNLTLLIVSFLLLSLQQHIQNQHILLIYKSCMALL